MNIAYEIRKWDLTHPVILIILRVILGLCLAIRGIYFLNNPLLLQNVIEGSSLASLKLTVAIGMFITWVHLLGGTFIVLGLLTRIAVMPQIPIVLGAIILVNTRSGLFATHSDLLFSIAILLLLILFTMEGGGKISMDTYLKKYLL